MSLRAPFPGSSPVTLIDALIAEQDDLSAVDRFAQWHDSSQAHPTLQPLYQRLLPASPPRPGEQYAFEVDLDACSGCKACVTACHSLNGLDDSESWRRVGLLTDASPNPAPRLQHVTAACHHCVEPGCLLGCPVLAYHKDPLTGIVRHLDDQCIGCTYCILMCPYEVPQYSPRLGIVRKCDLCQGRLAHGEAPACAQACPNEAIHITTVSQASLRSTYLPPIHPPPPSPQPTPFLLKSPDPGLTLPSTRYLQSRSPSLPIPAPPHLPLVVFLLLSQGAVGLSLLSAVARLAGSAPPDAIHRTTLVLQLIALAAATTHLGQPTRAWRSFLGWRTSWFSREVVAFSLWSALAALAAFPALPESFRTPLALALAATGIFAVACSAMIYVATRRRFWSFPFTTTRFLSATLTLGAVSWFPLAHGTSSSPPVLHALAFLALSINLLPDLALLRRPHPLTAPELLRSRRLLLGPLRLWCLVRTSTCAVALAMLALALVVPAAAAPAFWILLPAVLLTLVCERRLFFTAVAPDRMPGASPC